MAAMASCSRVRRETARTIAMANGRVLTADALKGLLQIDLQGNIEVLTTEAAGRAFRF